MPITLTTPAGYPDFSLGPSFPLPSGPSAMPNNAIRDSFEVIRQTRTAADDPDIIEYRLQQTIVFHIDVNTASTVNSTDFNAFMGQFGIYEPTYMVGSVDGLSYITQTEPLAWTIERISVDDNQNGTSHITVTITLLDEGWTDEDGNPVD